MPLADLVRHLNARAGDALPAPAPFVATRHGDVNLHFADLCLESVFLPIVDTRNGATHGHAAGLRVSGLSTGNPVAPEAVFVLPWSDAEFIQLDRRVRTLHALNYLTQRIRGNLLLSVHPRHVLGVADHHGLAFEEILRPCGLLPNEITLEIDIAGLARVPRHHEHLIAAVRNYRSRGYGIALRGSEAPAVDPALLRALAPQIIRVDPRLSTTGESLATLSARLRRCGARLLVDDEVVVAGRGGEVDLVQYASLASQRRGAAGVREDQRAVA